MAVDFAGVRHPALRESSVRIDGSSRLQSPAYRGVQVRAGDAGVFSAGGPAPEANAPAAGPLAPMTGIDVLLALQAVEDPRFAKRKAVRRGRSLLDALEDIRVDLLLGQVSEERLGQLLTMLSQARERSEPELDAVIDDIELRVRVELAKHGR